jgi:endonuclease/exonuclease/phosphatase (EEP) superfamily protein YafD
MEETVPMRSAIRASAARVSGALTGLWATAVLGVLCLVQCVGDRWWGVTVLLFLPRWLFLAPLPALALASGLAGSRRHWILQAAVGLLVAGPLMAVSVPIQQLWHRPGKGTRVRIMTLNRGMAPLDVDRLVGLMEGNQIDLICFQEGISRRNPRLEAYLESRGWYQDRGGYVASRYPIVAQLPQVSPDAGDLDHYPVHATRVRIRTPGGAEIGLVSVHMPTLRFGLYRFLEHDVDGLKGHIAWWERQAGWLRDGLAEMRGLPLLVGGDFNLPTDHAAMAALGSSFHYAFEDAGWGYGYTRPARYPWFRIDHILGSPEWQFTRCWVGPDVGSDHLPLVAEAVLPAPRATAGTTVARASRGRE